MAAPQQPYGTTQNWNLLHTNLVFDPNHSVQDLVQKAVLLFIHAYPEFDINDVLNKDIKVSAPEDTMAAKKIREFLATISELYGVLLPDNSTDWGFLAGAYNYVRPYRFIVAAKRFHGRNLCQNLRFRFENLDTRAMSAEVTLDDTDFQHHKGAFIDMSYDQLSQSKRENHLLIIEVKADLWEPSVMYEPLNSHYVYMANLHPEGYQQWVQFGRGVRLLIEITYRNFPHAMDTARSWSDFHLQNIHRMISKRLDMYAQRPVAWHQFLHTNNRVTCHRKLVDSPNSEEMYWRTPEGLNYESLKNYAENGGDIPPIAPVVNRTVLYFELQRSLSYSEDISESVCLCNEWCNWSAFFHYNPIYRFITVMTNQLFLLSPPASPELYLFAPMPLLVKKGADLKPRTGYLLRLLCSAENYRLSTHRGILGDPLLLQYYTSASPNALALQAITYKMMREEVDLSSLCQHFNVNPLHDDCLKAFLDFAEVFENLHHFVGQANQLVHPTHNAQRRWRKSLTPLIRKHVKPYFKTSYDLIFGSFFLPDAIQGKPIELDATDTVFGSDAEYSEFVTTDPEAQVIKYRRMRSLRSDINLLNFTVTLQPFVYTFISAYKFFTRIEAKLPTAREEDSIKDKSDYCIEFDEDFTQGYSQLSPPPIRFEVSENEMNEQKLDRHETIDILYTLKLYSFGFAIMKHCIEARAKALTLQSARPYVSLIADQFEFIYNHKFIEETVRNRRQTTLFRYDVKLPERMEDFYENFWGRPHHESANLNDMHLIILSANAQYQKLYVFLRSGGIQKLKFTAILTKFREMVEYVQQVAQRIQNVLLYPIRWICFDKKREEEGIDVQDVVMLYLIRAAAYALVKTVSILFDEMLYVEIDNQCQNDTSFLLGKPGWNELLRTYPMLITVVENLRTEYLVYDDELERIENTLSDCLNLCKHFYKRFYVKLSYQWIQENQNVYNHLATNWQQVIHLNYMTVVGDLLLLQTVVGLSFTCAFVNRYRYEFYLLRSYIMVMFDQMNWPHPQMDRFLHCRQLLVAYLTDQRAVRRAQPFHTALWLNHIQATAPHLVGLRPVDFNLDMNEANNCV